MKQSNFLDTSNSVSICTGLKTNDPTSNDQGKVYLNYLIVDSGRTALTTHDYYVLGTNNFRCIGVHHDASIFYALIENLNFIKIYYFPLAGGTLWMKDYTKFAGGNPKRFRVNSSG